MARRWKGKMNGERYLGNSNKAEVHDLDSEDTNTNGCQIDEIIKAEHERPFTSLSSAHSERYDNCDKCLAGSRR